jgi:RNA polymerase sigma-70 factor, ECF subfamily
VQETYVEAHRDFAQFRGSTEPEFAAWLRQILVRNLSRAVEQHILTAKRDVRRERSIATLGKTINQSSERMNSFLADPGKSPSAAMQDRQRSLDVADLVAQLSDTYREVVVLRNFQQMPFEEIAERMQRSPGAVRMLWLRALTQLRALMAARDDSR